MAENMHNEADTAMTVVADDSIKELLKSGTIEEIQKIVQEGPPSQPGTGSCFTWSPGQIIGKYEIIKRIGKGGMGVIYLARHTQLDSLRALKVLSGNSEANPVFAERFIREARIASQIRHPNVVEVMDVETDPQLNVSYIVMEYVDGGSLRQMLKAQSRLSIEQAIVTIKGVAAALCVAAEHGIVHRDIKPDNIMFTKDGGVKLADLGIAKKDDEEDSLTKTNVMMGTPAYLSPEQVENPKAVDGRSDIYSLGATFYEMLTGQTPYPGKSSYDILRKIFTDPVPDPRVLNPEIPGEIAAVVMKMLAKEPQKRFQTPQQLRDALERFIPELSDTDLQQVVKGILNFNSEGGVEATGSISLLTGTLCHMRERERRKKILLFAGGGALLGICILLILIFSLSSSSKKTEAAPRTVETNYTLPGNETQTRGNPELYSLNIRTTALAILRLTRDDGQVFTYAGNNEGFFTVSGLNAGEYEIELSCPGYLTEKKKYSVPVEGVLELPLKPDVKSMELTGVWGTKLELQCPDGRERVFTIPVDGLLQIRELRKGSYFLKASHKDYLPLERSLKLDDDLRLDLKMERVYKSFSVITLPGSKVELLQNFQVKFVQKTDSRGKNIFPQIKSGVYELRISAPHYKTHTSVLHIEKKDLQQTIPLEKALYALTVYATAGTRGVMYSGEQVFRKFEVASSGYLIINEIPQGKYHLTFSKEGFISQKHNVEMQGNTSLQITLNALAVSKSQSEKKKELESEGTLNLYLSASAELLNYLRTQGVELKLGDEEWRREKTFPVVRKLNAGEILLSVRGKGIEPLTDRSVRVRAVKSTDFLLELEPKPSKVLLNSNRADVLYSVNGSSFRALKELTVEPFREYTIVAKSRDLILKRKFVSSRPEEEVSLDFRFVVFIHPEQKSYEKGFAFCCQERYNEALPILLKAAQADHLAAVLLVAHLYEEKLGIFSRSRKEALRWYYRGAKLKDVDAAFKVAEAIYEGDFDAPGKDMLEFYSVSAKLNEPLVTYKISQIYKNGFKEVKADEVRSLAYLQKSAGLGYTEAMFELGKRYEDGKGVPRNSLTASSWFKKAAAQGHEQAAKHWKLLNPDEE